MNSTDVTVSRLKTAFEKKTNQRIDQKKLPTMQYEEMKKWGEKIELACSHIFIKAPDGGERTRQGQYLEKQWQKIFWE